MKKKQIKEKKSGTAKRYVETIKLLKYAILVSRYRATALANKKMWVWYSGVGKLISEKPKKEKWALKYLNKNPILKGCRVFMKARQAISHLEAV